VASQTIGNVAVTTPDGAVHVFFTELGPAASNPALTEGHLAVLPPGLVGDYQGLSGDGSTFVALYTRTNSGDTLNRTDVFADRVNADSIAASAVARLARGWGGATAGLVIQFR